MIGLMDLWIETSAKQSVIVAAGRQTADFSMKAPIRLSAEEPLRRFGGYLGLLNGYSGVQ